MSDPLEAMFRCPSVHKVVSTYNSLIVTLPWDDRRRLGDIFMAYLVAYDLEGVYERFNAHSIAQILAEFQPPEGWSPSIRWTDASRVARKGTVDEVRSIACPGCGGPVSIRFDSASPQPDGTTAGCLFLKCAKCSSGCCSDRLSVAPSWIDTLGIEFSTHPVDDSA